MGLLLCKARRDMGRHKGTFLALTLMVTIGTLAFTSVYGSYANLQDTIRSSHEDQDFHDGLITIKPRPAGDVAANADAVVPDNEVRLVAELPVTFPDDRSPIVARIISIPDAGGPSIDRLDYLDGGPPSTAEVVVEAGFADHHGLTVGDELLVHGVDGKVTLTVSGVAVSPEYLWPARNVVEHMPDVLRRWGVLYAREASLADWTGLAGQANQVVFASEDPAIDVLDQLQARFGAENVIRIETRDNQASTTQLSGLIGALGAIAFALPFLFLLIAGLSTYVLLSRLVHLQRGNIGLLRALGYNPGTVLWHYVSYAPMIAIIGSLVGFGLGYALSFYVTGIFASFTSLHHVDVLLRPSLGFIGLVLSLAATIVAAVIPARRAAKLLPSEAMRAPSPATGRHSRLERILPFLRSAPDSMRLGWRNVGRNRRRAAMTAAGLALAVAAVLAPLALLDSLNAAVDLSVERLQRNDAVVVLTGPVNITAVDAASNAPGVRSLEPVLQVPTSVRAGDTVVDMTILGMRPDQQALALQDASGEPRQVSSHGLLLTRVFGNKGLEVGDTLDLFGQDVTVLGFVDGFGPAAYVELGALQQWTSAGPVANQALATWNDSRLGRASLEEGLPVATIQDVEQARTDAREMLRLFYGFAAFIVAFGIIIAASIAFNAVSINILEEGTQHATLRTLGFPMQSLAVTVLTETITLAVPGVLLGLPLGYWLADRIMSLIVTDIFVLDLSISWLTYTLPVLGILLAVTLATIPGLRSIARLDLGRATRERAR